MIFTGDDALRLCGHLAQACWPGRDIQVFAEGLSAGVKDGHGHTVIMAEETTSRRAKFKLAARLCRDVAKLCDENAKISMARKKRKVEA